MVDDPLNILNVQDEVQVQDHLFKKQRNFYLKKNEYVLPSSVISSSSSFDLFIKALIRPSSDCAYASNTCVKSRTVRTDSIASSNISRA
jgi:hypothetical protein